MITSPGEQFSEKIIRTLGFGLNLRRVASRTLPAIQRKLPKSSQEVRVGSIQTPFKYHPCHDALYIKLLCGSDRVKLFFVQHPIKGLTKRFLDRLGRLATSVGLDLASRVEVLPFSRREAFLNTVRTFDFILDTPLWSGGNTSLDAALQGVPVISFGGQTLRGNHSAALNQLLGSDNLCNFSSTNEFLECFLRDPLDFIRKRPHRMPNLAIHPFQGEIPTIDQVLKNTTAR